MMDVVLELLLVWTCGCGMLLAAFVVGDVTGDWMTKAMRKLSDRIQRARIRMGWWEVAAAHKRKVKC